MYYKPSYVPQNGAANILVRHLAEQLGLKLNKKYEIVLASFLAVAKKVNGQAFDWWTGNQNKNPKLWSLFPHVTNTSVRKVFKLLEEEFLTDELRNKDRKNKKLKFSDYKRDRSLLIKVATNYSNFGQNVNVCRLSLPSTQNPVPDA